MVMGVGAYERASCSQPESVSPVFRPYFHTSHVSGLQADDALLGYVVLPAHMQLDLPIDIYWHDRRIQARLRP